MSIAQLALPERPALAIGVPGEPGSSGAAVADGALSRIPAGDYMDLSGHCETRANILREQKRDRE
jgi:hypothetical protein